MSGTANQHDPERGLDGQNHPSGSDETRRYPRESHGERNDFDDSANDLWSLYGREARSHDEARIHTLKDDMDGVLIFAGLFSSVLSAFALPKIQDLTVNPLEQSVYYQQQTVRLLAQVSQQIASIGTPTSINPTIPPPFPTFHPSASDRRVNIVWLVSLVCSLSAALLATLVQQWVRAYMRVFQQSSKPLKTARIRLFLFEGVKFLPVVAEAVPALVHVSLILFLWGLGDVIKHIDTMVYITTIVPIAINGFFYFFFVIAPIWNPQSPFRTPFSAFLWYLIQIIRILYHRLFNPREKVPWPTSLETRQEEFAMKPTEDRKERDVRGVQWLVDNINGSNETEAFVLAIPGSFNQEWGQHVWNAVVGVDTPSTDVPVRTDPGRPYLSKGSTIHDLCRCVQYLFESYNNEGGSVKEEARRLRLHGCVETAASLVCCTDVKLESFGEVGKLLSELGHNERIHEPSTIRSNPSFTIRWTCLSLVATWKMVRSNRLQQLAKFAVNGIAHFKSYYGVPDPAALESAQIIDEHLKNAWKHVEDLRLAFEPWGSNRTDEEVREILNIRKETISKLELIAGEVDGMEGVDWRISLLQDAMDESTHKLTRHLPGVFFDRLKLPGPVLISEAFDFPLVETSPVPPQLIFPGQQVQSLYTLGRRLRDIVE
ncbi:hypothetical protein F5148DRAFT_212707 [Russula earlei]|uniref:Uncharacterized protein n=1 Tax=Russula earlei TaxID=71964 RepID=A0ACC0U4T4_9AGAM|nr:hypothetical protein F5148DRAFT_212707 [Russula earlei]